MKMDEGLSSEYTESFDSLISRSNKDIKSVVTELDSHDTSIQSYSVDTDCGSPLSTECSGRWTTSRNSVEKRTPDLSASQSKLRFSRYFGESQKYSTDFTGSGADLNTYSSFESLSDDSRVESDKDEETVTVFSAASDSDTQTCSSVSQELSMRWKNEDGDEEMSTDSQHQSSQNSSHVFR